jgi:hypothetical protein
MVSVRDKRVKLIDLGAAADLRLGINYVPNEYLLDPRWVVDVREVSTQKVHPAILQDSGKGESNCV